MVVYLDDEGGVITSEVFWSELVDLTLYVTMEGDGHVERLGSRDFVSGASDGARGDAGDVAGLVTGRPALG